MIDTVRFKIPVEKELYDEIKSKGNSFLRRDNLHKEEWLRYLTTNVELGSYERAITLFSYEEDYVLMECSLPKQYRGENISLLYPSEIITALKTLHQQLTTVFPAFPSYEKWQIIRLDICYAWRLSSSAQVEKILEMLKLLDYPRKNKYIYRTAVMFKGHHYSLKFYLKYKEFLHHDFIKIKDKNPELAANLLQISMDVIRFEITYRKEQLKTLFEKNKITYLDLIDKNFFEKTMTDVINKLLQHRSKESMSDVQILNKLKYLYKPDKAIRLFNFYKSYYSEHTHLKQLQKDSYHPSTIWRNLRDISNAGVGISNNLLDFDFNLDIPSDLVVNDDPLLPRKR